MTSKKTLPAAASTLHSSLNSSQKPRPNCSLWWGHWGMWNYYWGSPSFPTPVPEEGEAAGTAPQPLCSLYSAVLSPCCNNILPLAFSAADFQHQGHLESLLISIYVGIYFFCGAFALWHGLERFSTGSSNTIYDSMTSVAARLVHAPLSHLLLRSSFPFV